MPMINWTTGSRFRKQELVSVENQVMCLPHDVSRPLECRVRAREIMIAMMNDRQTVSEGLHHWQAMAAPADEHLE